MNGVRTKRLNCPLNVDRLQKNAAIRDVLCLGGQGVPKSGQNITLKCTELECVLGLKQKPEKGTA